MPVYLIRAGTSDAVKIGWCDGNVEVRRDQLQTGNHEPLVIIRTIDCEPGAEGWLHAHFRQFRLRGEWFVLAPEMLTIDVEGIRPQPQLVVGDRQATLAAIENFLTERDMKASTFGILAFNDSHFVPRLRSGANVTTKTLERALRFMAERPRLSDAA